MILQLAILFAFLALGEAVTALAGIPVPGSITGMILLTVSLQTRLIRIEWVERGASLLVDNLGFFFIPAGVGCHELLRTYSRPVAADHGGMRSEHIYNNSRDGTCAPACAPHIFQ